MRTGRGGKGLGSLYEVCMEEEELEEERRAVREVEEEETGARSAPGRVTGKNEIWEEERETEGRRKIKNIFFLFSNPHVGLLWTKYSHRGR